MKRLCQLLLLAVIWVALTSCSDVFSKNRGIVAPDFELETVDGTILRLDDYKGEKVYLYFWASWCSICLSGMNELEELIDDNEQFTVIAIASPGIHPEKNPEEFKAWFASLGYDGDFTVLLDEGGTVYEQFEMDGYPSSAWIGSDGRLTEKRTGHVTNSEVLELMNSIR